MKVRAWLAAVALLTGVAAYAPMWVANAQDMGDDTAKEGKEDGTEEKAADYDSAKEVLGSLSELAKEKLKDPRKPTDEEIVAFFESAFPRCADYLDQHPDAEDRAQIYKWAGPRGQYAYGQPGFVRIANAYLAENKDAEDRNTWADNALFARLGIEAEAKAAKEELTKADADAKADPARRLELADIWLRHFAKQKDSESAKKLIEKLSKDESITKAEDPQVERRLMRTVLANAEKAEIKDGEAFPDWASIYPVKDIDGKSVSVADYKGKILLIDFWAVWCGPCMGEMPNVIKLYNEVHEQGFEIIGVSLDMESGKYDLQSLKDTIAGKGRVGEMPWRQIYDGGYWSSGLPKHYGINSIPRTVLIDQNGVVVANGLRGEELASKVKELLETLPKEEGSK
ncbi:MAG: TlpA family protein disulfide reductase [Planctomycetes bacterium]|nr:TlpA family protein disulfide reductase [Planctomycetota bacterium]